MLSAGRGRKLKAVVVDNCTLCRYRLREQNWQYTKPLVDAIRSGNVVAYAPAHLLIEYFHVVQKGLGQSATRSRTIKRHEDWLLSLRVQFLSVDYLVASRELRFLVNRGADSYDAIYIYLAMKMGRPLWTCDTGILSLSRKPAALRVADLHRGPHVP